MIRKRAASFTFVPLALSVSMSAALAVPVDGGTLDPLTIPKYVTPLVIPPVMNTTGVAEDYDIGMRQFNQQILPGGIWNTVNGRADAFPATPVWSYGPATDPRPDSRALGGAQNTAPAPNSQFNYPAYTIEATKDINLTIDWINQLVRRPDRCRAVGGVIGTEGDNDCKYRPHLLPVDQTLHWANPKARCDKGELRTDCHGQSQNPYRGPVPIVTHVHGAHTSPASDGYTEGWWLPNASNVTCVPRDANGDPERRPAAGEFVCEGTIANLLTDRIGGLNENITTENATGVGGFGAFEYLNDQPSTTLWYHDHALGMTRVNVYAGPAGYWLIRDPASPTGETGLPAGNNLPAPAPVAGEDLATTNFPATLGGSREKYREIPVVIQDRAFNADGTLFYPDNRAFFEGLNVEGTAGTDAEQFPGAPELQIDFAGNNAQDKVSDIAPIWNPEAFFNTMVVNGTTWPVQEVAPALYRFRLLNGSNSRFLNLAMPVTDALGNQITVQRTTYIYGDDGRSKAPKLRPVNELRFWQIGSEQSLMPEVVAVRTGFATAGLTRNKGGNFPNEAAASDPQQALLMGLAERADVIVDFRGLPDGTIITMTNTAPDTPFGGFPDVPADPSTTGQVMRFVVNQALLGASPTDELHPNIGAILPDGRVVDNQLLSTVLNPLTAATQPWDLVVDPAAGLDNFATIHPINPVPRELALVEEESALVCVDVDLAGNVIQLPEIPIGPVCPTATALPFAPKAAVVGTVDATGAPTVTLWSDPIVTDVGLDTAEQWNIWNFTVDGHPIHVHLVKYKVLGRAAIGGGPSIINTPTGAQPWENGWKDTVISYPGEITSVAADFDIQGLYVWHCHIVEHEDNEMMVPFCVGGSQAQGGVCPDKLF